MIEFCLSYDIATPEKHLARKIRKNQLIKTCKKALGWGFLQSEITTRKLVFEELIFKIHHIILEGAMLELIVL